MTERAVPDMATVLAIGAVAYVAAKLLHEAVGHGVVCASVGGTWEGFSICWNMCNYDAVGDWPRRLTKAGGTLANLTAGTGALILAPFFTRATGATRYFVWLLAAVNTLMAAGYLAVDPLFGFGDWTAFLERLPGAAVIRWVLAAAGIGLYALFVVMLLRRLRPFLGAGGRGPRATARRLTLFPYLISGGVLVTGAALLNSLGPIYALTSGLATLGGTSALAWMAACVDDKARTDDPIAVERSWPWIAVGVVVAAVCVVVLGPGLVFAR
jgi:hypothetical protein